MTALFRFLDARCEHSNRAHSFTLYSGEIRLLQLSSKAEKDAMIDLAIGETVCGIGNIEIAQSNRRCNDLADIVTQRERVPDDEIKPTTWQPLSASSPGSVGWIAANGSLISNLKIWENITLPLWYHARRDVVETEKIVTHWLAGLGMAHEAFAEFLAASPDSVEPWQLKLAGLLRALVQMPKVLVVDAAVLEDVNEHWAQCWIAALEAYAAQDHAVLAVADKATILPWEKIE